MGIFKPSQGAVNSDIFHKLESLNTKVKKPKEKKLTHIQQIMILEYLGIGKQLDDNTKKAEIFSELIGRDLETTRQYLSYINKGEVRIDKNLNPVLAFFKKAGLSDMVELVEKELSSKK
jgi:hypothetical protein